MVLFVYFPWYNDMVISAMSWTTWEILPMKVFLRMTLTLLVLIFLYLFLMTAVYLIPNRFISENVESALGVIQDEGAYPHYFFDYPFGQADNNTDKEMYLNLLTDDGDSVLRAAMIPRYPYYWQGYAVFLRPLSVFLSIANIRYLNMAALIVLLCLSFHKITQRINAAAAVTFTLGLIASFCWLAPFNIQYFTVTMLTLIFSLVVLHAHQHKRLGNVYVLFLCFGSLTNFFDFLTFPILTLGYPLILLLLLRRQDSNARTFGSEALLLLACSASWCAGYGLTVLAKGVLGTLFAGTNVLSDITKNALNRINGPLPEGYSTDASAWMAIRYNASAFFNLRNIFLLAGSVICAAAAVYRRRDTFRGWKASLPLLGAALFPYIWYAVLENHSIVHCYFTFKAQAVTFFGVCAYLISLADFSGKALKFHACKSGGTASLKTNS